ncbi:hypothetical protein ABW19_dt0200916 [Dactylella cylindrospora]|nr:hypothetical protein ABW19_dt0200916 [Dactylella cylindrospora]
MNPSASSSSISGPGTTSDSEAIELGPIGPALPSTPPPSYDPTSPGLPSPVRRRRGSTTNSSPGRAGPPRYENLSPPPPPIVETEGRPFPAAPRASHHRTPIPPFLWVSLQPQLPRRVIYIAVGVVVFLVVVLATGFSLARYVRGSGTSGTATAWIR